MKKIFMSLVVTALAVSAVSANKEKTECHKSVRETQKGATKDCKAKHKGEERKQCIEGANTSAKEAHKACDAGSAAPSTAPAN